MALCFGLAHMADQGFEIRMKERGRGRTKREREREREKRERKKRESFPSERSAFTQKEDGANEQKAKGLKNGDLKRFFSMSP